MNKFDMWFLQEIFEKRNGTDHVLNFSDRTFSDFFEREIEIDIDDPRYAINGTSQGRRLLTFLRIESGVVVARALRAIWEYWDATDGPFDWQESEVRQQRESFFRIVRLAESAAGIATDPTAGGSQSESLDELVSKIERDIRARELTTALDRLHTFCMSRFAHVLRQQGTPSDDDDPLNSRVEKYLSTLEQEGQIHAVALGLMRSSVSAFDGLAFLRNRECAGQDGAIVEKMEARLIFDSITGILRFMQGFEMSRLGQQERRTQSQDSVETERGSGTEGVIGQQVGRQPPGAVVRPYGMRMTAVKYVLLAAMKPARYHWGCCRLEDIHIESVSST